jgi:DNA-binding CsgD family transcriptional regulator/N-acetylneuraminic acid mutarotase
LTERELEILKLVATGASNKEIANQLAIRPNTVKVHLRNIFAKIGVQSRTEAALYAVRNGLVVLPGNQALPELRDEDEQGEPASTDPAVSAPTPPPRTALPTWLLAASAILVVVVLALAWWAAQRAPANVSAQTPPADLLRWTSQASLPGPRSAPAAVVYANVVYLIGGADDSGPVAATLEFDPANGAWATRAPRPVAARDAHGAVIGGLIYVPGGTNAQGLLDRLDIYNPRTNRWSAGAPMPAARAAYALAALDGRLYVIGGLGPDGPVDTVFEYAPEGDAWTARSPMPIARAYAGAAVVAGRVFVIGGRDAAGPVIDNQAYAPEVDGPGADPWTALAPLPSPRDQVAVAAVADIIHVFDGSGVPPVGYQAADDTWVQLPMPEAETLTQSAGSAVLGQQIHLFGGSLDGRATDSHLSYQAIFIINLPALESGER